VTKILLRIVMFGNGNVKISNDRNNDVQAVLDSDSVIVLIISLCI